MLLQHHSSVFLVSVSGNQCLQDTPAQPNHAKELQQHPVALCREIYLLLNVQESHHIIISIQKLFVEWERILRQVTQITPDTKT